MEDQKKVTISSLGLNTDGNLEEGEYSFALNATSATGISPWLGNLEGNELADYIPPGYIILGSRLMNNNESVVMLGSFSGDSEIGSFKDKKYTTVVNDPNLRFNVGKQITVRYKLSYNGHRIIYWTDDNEPPRWMDFDSPNFKRVVGPDRCTLVPTKELDLDTMKIFKNYDVPCIKLIDTPETGGCDAAGYFITGQYASAAGYGMTAWFPSVGVIPIFKTSLSSPFEYIDGSNSEEKTSKAIKVSIESADLSFTHINIGIIKVVNGVRSAFKVATIPITTTEYTYTGIGNTEKIVALDEILAPAVVYSRAKDLETTDSELLLGNLRSIKEFNWQPFISKIGVQWQVFKAWSDDKVNSFKNPAFAAYMRVFRQDEVYALGIEIDFVDGTTTRAYPLIGRKMNQKHNGAPFTLTQDSFGNTIDPLQWDDAATASGNDMLNNTETRRHQIYNTATLEGTLDNGTGLGVCEYGEMGYWESERTYPCDKEIYGSDAGKPIRHFKMPDSNVFHIHDGENANRKYEERVKLNYLGIKLPNIADVFNTLPTDIKSQVKRWRLVVGDRTYSKSVVASGIVFNGRKQNWIYNQGDKDDIRLFPNYPLNDLRPDPYIKDAHKWVYNPPLIIDPFNPNPVINASYYHKDYLKDTFFFHGPDTHFKKEFLSSTEMKLNVELYGKTSSFYDWVEPYPDFKEKGGDNDRAALQGVSIGWYNNFKRISQGNVRRNLKEALYVPFNSRVSGGNAGIPVWNTFRESSVLLATGKEFADPSHKDTSRFILNNDDDNTVEQMNCDMKKLERNCSLYYASIKRKVPDQYGDISDIRYIDTYPCKPNIDLPDNVYFGGDTFIGAMSLKLQQVFYQNEKQFIDADNGLAGADFRPAETIAHTTYFYRNRGNGGNPRTQSNMMCEDNRGTGIFGLFGDGNATALGYLALVMYGVPNFWVESDFNIELRNPGVTPAETFYRNLNHGSYRLTDWLNIRNIDQDNKYYVNQDYSSVNVTKLIEGPNTLYDPKTDEAYHYSTRTIYSLESHPENIYDNWTVFKPLNYYDLPKNKGELMGIHYLGNYKIFFRTTESAYLHSLFSSLESSAGQILLGSGKLFERRPEEIITSEGGFGGSINQFCYNNTEAGLLYGSSESGKIFLFINNQLINLASPKFKNSTWLASNLPFNLSKQVKDIAVDNAANPEAIGLISGFNEFTNEWYITKKDYKLLDANNASRITVSQNRLLLDGKPVSLSNKDLFENKSWTFAFDLDAQRWRTWNSFLPNFYLHQKNTIFSGENTGQVGIWEHNSSKVFNTFYGRKYPFIVTNRSFIDGISTFSDISVSFITRTQGPADKSKKVTFNKAICSNLYECSGLLNLIIQDEDDLSQLYAQLSNTAKSRDVALRIREGGFNFSDFFDIYDHSANHFFIDNWSNQDYRDEYFIDKILNHSTLDYATDAVSYGLLREKYMDYRLILDNRHDLKLLLQFVTSTKRPSLS